MTDLLDAPQQPFISTPHAREALDLDTSERVAQVFDTLSDPTRVRIIAALAWREMTAGELGELIGMSKSATSHQLRILRDRRIVRTRRQGRNIFVALDDEHITELFQRCLEHVRHG